MDFLRRHLAPIHENAWDEIDDQAKISLKQFLSARGVVDLSGPFGLDFESVSTGRMKMEKDSSNINYGIRESLPVLEPRVSFKLNIWELDDIARGAKDPDLESLENAAQKIAFFEENIIYNGLKKSGIKGLLETENSPQILPKDTSKWTDKIIQAIYKFKELAIEGPYALVLSPDLWQEFSYLTSCGCSKREQLEKLLQGPVVLSHFLKSGLLVSLRGGDFELSLGQDFCVGYENSTNKEVSLYLTESFTFQVFEPNAVIPITA